MAKRQISKKKKKASSKEQTPSEVRFHYIKGAQFRTVHLDGIHGGLTPQGLIQMAIFSERFPIPRETVQPVIDGVLGPENRKARVARDGVVREVEVNLVMHPNQARSIVDWLRARIKDSEKIKSTAKVQAAGAAKKTGPSKKSNGKFR